jgi:hypothetical protein
MKAVALCVFALALVILYIARAVIVIFAFSILFACLINPIDRFLQRHSLFFQEPERAARCASLSGIGHPGRTGLRWTCAAIPQEPHPISSLHLAKLAKAD